MRWIFAALIVLVLAGSAGFAGWDHFGASWKRAEDADDWRHRQLLFLKAAYDRLDAQISKKPNAPGADSLRGEQNVIRQMMVETAKALSADEIPPTISAVVVPMVASTGQSAPATDQSAEPSPIAVGAEPVSAASAPTAPLTAIAAPPTNSGAPVAASPSPAAPRPIVMRTGLNASADTSGNLIDLSRDPKLDRPARRSSQ